MAATKVRLTLAIAGLGERDEYVEIEDKAYADGLIAQEFAIPVSDDDPDTSIEGHGDGDDANQGEPAKAAPKKAGARS